MKRVKKVLHKIIKPSNAAICIVDAIAVPLLVVALAFLSATNPVSLFAYLLSTYALVISVTGIKRLVEYVRLLVRNDRIKCVVLIKRVMRKNKYMGLYLDDKDFRARVSLYFGLALNLLFAIYKCGAGMYYRSAWLWSIGFYYIFLGIIRFVLMKRVRSVPDGGGTEKEKYHEYKTYRLCGCMIMALNLAVAGMTVQMIWKDSVTPYSQIAVIISATYTFYIFISSISNAISFRKRKNAILSAAKYVNLTAAFVAMFSLQNSMIYAFEKADQIGFRRLMNSITGAFVLIIVLGLSTYMIINGTKKMNYFLGKMDDASEVGND